ncbi:MAG: methyltransferase, partial [Rhodocyclaceae bacterium]|nr:methyltransferase [Rhodocyclaceae bacterium]
VLDLGCGKALVAAWLGAAAALHRRGDWPADRPPPPSLGAYHGIDRSAADIAVATQALAGPSWLRLTTGDLPHAALPSADVVLLLDVLHYLDAAAQHALLLRVREALPDDGRLLLRVGDAEAGAGYRFGTVVDRLVCLGRGQSPRIHGRSLRAWRALLDDLALDVSSRPMNQGTPFANILLLARPR